LAFRGTEDELLDSVEKLQLLKNRYRALGLSDLEDRKYSSAHPGLVVPHI